LATVDRSVQSQNAAQLAAQVQVARADAALAQNEYERSEALVGRGFVSKADLDRKKAARDAAFARIRVAEANLNSMRAQIGPSAGMSTWCAMSSYPAARSMSGSLCFICFTDQPMGFPSTVGSMRQSLCMFSGPYT
jgi:hypothetical protein